jgi:hypothetical protein
VEHNDGVPAGYTVGHVNGGPTGYSIKRGDACPAYFSVVPDLYDELVGFSSKKISNLLGRWW